MTPQKMRESGAGPEEMMKICQGSSDMPPAQQKMVPLPFGEHPQQEYGMAPGHPFPCFRVQAATVVYGISENQSGPTKGLTASAVICHHYLSTFQ
jgi:hypothetical protein